MPAGEEGIADETSARIDYSAPGGAARPGQPLDAASAPFSADNVAAIRPKVTFEDKTAVEEGQIVPRFVSASEKFGEPGVVNVLNRTGGKGRALGTTIAAADTPVNAAEPPTGDAIPDEQQGVVGQVEEEKAVEPVLGDFVFQPTVDADTYEMRAMATTNPTASPGGLSTLKEHLAAENSDEDVAAVCAMDMTLVEAGRGAKASSESSPTQGLAAVESVVDDTTGVVDTVDSGGENPSASEMTTSESDGPSTASTDDTNVEPASGDTTARARRELNLIKKLFRKLFRKKGKRRRASKKKKAAALKDRALAEGKEDDEETLGARARGDEAFLVGVAREPEAGVETGAGTKDGEDSSICDERKPAAIERPVVREAAGASTAMINPMNIMEFGPMDTE